MRKNTSRHNNEQRACVSRFVLGAGAWTVVISSTACQELGLNFSIILPRCTMHGDEVDRICWPGTQAVLLVRADRVRESTDQHVSAAVPFTFGSDGSTISPC